MGLRERLMSDYRFTAIFLITAAFALYVGYEFYKDQLLSTTPLFWIFVPDCPLYALLAIFSYFRIVKSALFDYILSIGLVKYGLWTLFIFALYPNYYFSDALIIGTMILLLGHSAMVLAGLILFLPRKVSLGMLLVGLGWFLLNDFMDYVINLYPRIPTEKLWMVAAVTVMGSIVITVVFYLLRLKTKGAKI